MSRTALATAVLTFATAAPALADDDMPAPWHAWERATGDWAGVRPRLVDRGITVNAALTVDTFANVRGGADTEGVGVEHLFDLALTLDTERLLGHPGGTVYVLFQNHAGDRVSDRVGDLYGIGGLDADGRTQVSEAWFDQQLFDDRLRVRVGKIDAQMEFAAYNTLPIPAYPDPAFGFDAFVTPTDHTYVGFGFFDGSLAAGTRTGALGPAPLFDGDGGYFLIAEAGWRWEDPWAGRLGRALGGAWHHTGSLPRVTGVGTRTGDTGAYAAAEQTLWAPSADDDEENDEDEDDASARGVSAYVQYSYAGGGVSEIPHQVGGGITWTGPLPTREADVLGAAVTCSWTAPDAGLAHSYELVTDVYYLLQVTPFLSIQPAVAYVRHPGTAPGRDDALLILLRARIDF